MYMMEQIFFQVNNIFSYKIFFLEKITRNKKIWVKFFTFYSVFYMNIMITTCIEILI
jgi:hypothetical protein